VSTALSTNDVDVLTEEREEEESQLSKDDLFELLKNPRRRAVLRFLDSTDGTATLSELAEHIAAQENDIEVKQLNAYQRKRVYVALYQCHLPKMDDTGIIDYDQDRGNIEMREEADQLLGYLDTKDEPETDWSRRYIALSAGGGAVAATAQFIDIGFVARTGMTIAVLALFLGVSLLHTYETR
jgi:DNA-binding transcriptional ArsR family regulator